MALGGDMHVQIGLIGLLLLAACSSAPERRSVNYKSNSQLGDDDSHPDKGSGGSKKVGDGSNAIPDVDIEVGKVEAQKLAFSDARLIQDGLDYTQAAVEITASGKGPYTLKGRYLFDSQLSSLDSAQAKVLGELCQSILVSGEGNTLKVSWRSHYSQQKKEALEAALSAGHKSTSCVAVLKDENDASVYLQFDPMPIAASGMLGSADAKKAVETGVMMLVSSPNLSFQDSSLGKLSDANPSFDSIKSITAKALLPLVSKEIGAACAYQSGSTSAVSNPNNAKDFTAQLDGVTIKSATPVAVAGKILKSCANVQVVANGSQAALAFTCGVYQETKNEGLEAGCQWTLAVENPSDKEDSAEVTLAMPKLTYAAASAKNWPSGKDLVAKSPKNPVRAQSLKFNGFDATQTAFLEKTLDVILEVAPDIFAADFENYMRTANFSASGSCSQNGVMGFASINSTAITLCRYMFGSGIDSPSAVVGAAHTILHEVRHARGFYHDIDRPNYAPCGGSAYSNVFDHNIVVTCSSAYCPLLKTAAEGSYLNDINYSLRGDARRFQGQCKTWQSAMGLTDDRVNRGR